MVTLKKKILSKLIKKHNKINDDTINSYQSKYDYKSKLFKDQLNDLFHFFCKIHSFDESIFFFYYRS